MRKQTEAKDSTVLVWQLWFALSTYDDSGVLPVHHERPDNHPQKDFILSEAKDTPVKKEREMRADDNSEALGEVPVPRMRAVEIRHTVEDVELQEVELNHGPLKKTRP